ncbi:MAG: hypothetical protein F6K17_40615, partial [Okeania sp. SIO3C4]|nr:hypothetical protein [Okeania sp. SIO3C4]
MPSKPLVNLLNWNPQLFREIKGRLTKRNVAIAISVSLLCQFLVMLLSQFKILNLHWIFLAVMLIGGVYMLVENIAKEKHLGTLNFIRLSPQSSQNILLGKLLGVPILIYLAVAISLPLHLWANISSGLSLSWFFGFYGVLITFCCFFYNLSLLFAFLGVTQAWLIATITGIFLLSGITQLFDNEIYYVIRASIIYFGTKELLILSTTIILGLILGSYWIWKALNHRYQNPN